MCVSLNYRLERAAGRLLKRARFIMTANRRRTGQRRRRDKAAAPGSGRPAKASDVPRTPLPTRVVFRLTAFAA